MPKHFDLSFAKESYADAEKYSSVGKKMKRCELAFNKSLELLTRAEQIESYTTPVNITSQYKCQK
jgi:hypothetical protein